MFKKFITVFFLALSFSAFAATPLESLKGAEPAGNLLGIWNAEVYRSNRPHLRIIAINVNEADSNGLCKNGSDWMSFRFRDSTKKCVEGKEDASDIILYCSNRNTTEGCYTEANFLKKYPNGRAAKCTAE